MGSERGSKGRSRDSSLGTRESWPKVAIIVLNWNGWRDTIECLESLQRITYPNYQIIVVDNGSTDDSVEKIKAWARGEITVESKFFEYDPSTKPVQWIEYDRATAEAGGIAEEEAKLAGLPPHRRFVLIKTQKNLGFAGGNNIGIKYALAQGVEYVLLLNNDTTVSREFLEPLIDFMENNYKVGIIGPRIVFYDMPSKTAHGAGFIDWVRGRPISEDATQPTECEFVTGACTLIRRPVFEKLGGLLAADYFLYWEETDFCARARKYGYKTYYFPEVKILHKVSQSTGLGNRNPSAMYYYRRNRILFMKKHAPKGCKVSFYLFLFCVQMPGSLLKSILRHKGIDKDELRAILKSFINGLMSKSGRRWF